MPELDQYHVDIDAMVIAIDGVVRDGDKMKEVGIKGE